MSTKRPASPGELFPLIYGELRRVAGRYLGRERRNHTLQPTALVHEAWIRLQSDRAVAWQGRTHGLALGAQAMRRLLVDHGRHQKRDKRGGGAQPVSLDDLMKAGAEGGADRRPLLALEAALSRLEAVDHRAAQVVILHFSGCPARRSRATWGCRCERSKPTGRTRGRGSTRSCQAVNRGFRRVKRARPSRVSSLRVARTRRDVARLRLFSLQMYTSILRTGRSPAVNVSVTAWHKRLGRRS